MLAKFGYVARGSVFLLVATLALLSNLVGEHPESKSAISSMLNQPFGEIWVGVTSAGLFCFIAWLLAQAFADIDGHGADFKGFIIRASLLGSAVIYMGLGSHTLGPSLFAGGGGEGSCEKGLAAWVISQPCGPYLTTAVGIGFFAGGCAVVKGLTHRFEKYIEFLWDHLGLPTFASTGWRTEE